MSIRNLINSAKPASKTEAKKASTRISRVEAVVSALSAMRESGEKAEDVLKIADQIYVEKGGKSNLNECFFNFNRTAEVFELLGLLENRDEKLFLTSKFHVLKNKPEAKKATK